MEHKKLHPVLKNFAQNAWPV